MSLLQHLHVAEPEDLGEVVMSRLGQAIEIGHHPVEGAEIYFASNGSPAKLMVLDLLSGKLKRQFELPTTDAIWGMTIGTDQCVYLAGTSGGLLYRYDPTRATLESLGSFPSDPWVWDMTATADQTIFGCTYPEAKVFEYNSNENTFTDWGRVDESSVYARSIYATERYIYVGLGSTVKVARLDRELGQWSEIIIPGYSGDQGFAERIHVFENLLFVYVQKKATVIYDLKRFAIIATIPAAGALLQGEGEDKHSIYFCSDNKLYRWNSQTLLTELLCSLELTAGAVLGGIKTLSWIERSGDDKHDGKLLAIVTAHGYCFLYDPRLGYCKEIQQDIPFTSIHIHALGSDEERLYVGGYHRALSIWNIKEEKVEHSFPHFPQIEGMTVSQGDLYFGVYTQALVYRYKPNLPVQGGTQHAKVESNPACLFKIGEGQDRPFALAEGDDYVFFGSTADYGLLDGAVTIFNASSGTYKVHKGVVPNQSVVSLAYKDGLLYGSTSVWGGLGIEPAEKEAKLFIWDVKKEKLIDSFTPNIPCLDCPPRMIGELSFGPDGLLWGIIEGTIFAYEPSTMALVKARLIYPSLYQFSKWRPCFLRWGADGLLYTTLDRKLIVIDPATLEHRAVDEHPHGLIAIGPDGHLYYAEGASLKRRKIVRPC